MEQYILTKILEHLTQGNVTEFIAYFLIFIFIWIEVRGMKKELHNMNTNISKSFKKGEERFEIIESNQLEFDTRVTQLETRIENFQIQMSGFEHKLGGKTSERNSIN